MTSKDDIIKEIIENDTADKENIMARTKKELLQEKLAQKQQEICRVYNMFRILARESDDVFEILAPDGTIKYISEASERVIGFTPAERTGRKVFEFYEGVELQKLKMMLELALSNSGKEIKDMLMLKTREGKDIFLEVIMKNLLHEPVIEGIAVNFRDITKSIEMSKRMEYISTHDELTGLPNKVHFINQVNLLCRHVKETGFRFAVIMLEIGGFKYINDALGYHVGDLLITKVSQQLQSLLGESDFLCRYSGVRFAIIVQGLSTIEGYENYAGNIVRLFENSFTVDKYELDVSVCMGISLYRKDESAEALIGHAESALFWNRNDKNKGRSYRFYSSDISIYNYKQFELRNDLRKTIERNQLKVHYQPIVDLATNEIIAAEALIRWEHPEWGMVPLKEFIPLAEETGFIIYAGNWILREVCRNYKQWLDSGLPAIKVSVNISGVQFFQSNFVENIKSIIDEFGLDPHFLITEITESILINKSEKMLFDIERLRSYGIQVALDDFGAGFSSLSYLNSFNIDILKIDGSFIKNIDSDGVSSVITRNIINMARELKLKLVMEGIENWEQLNYLREIKCRAGQGFIYSRPVPQKHFERILARRKCKPIVVNNTEVSSRENRRKFFRIKFHQLLEADLTILKIKGKDINVGNTKVLIKNMGPGGLCFITNLKFPVENDFLLQFVTEMIDTDIRLYGYPVWSREQDNDLYEYGIEFTLDENDRADLIKILNQVQIKMRNNIMFAEGSFTSASPRLYFSSVDG